MTRKNIFVLIFVFLVASLLVACASQPLNETQVSNIVATEISKIEFPEQQVPDVYVEVVVPEAEKIEPVDNEPDPEELEVEEPVVQEQIVDQVILPDCPLKDQGRRIEFTDTLEKEDGFYYLSSEIEQLAQYVDCNVLVEYRNKLVEEHHISIFYATEWELPILEGSLWVYPANWNMSDFSTEKPPIASEFVTAKRRNQLENGYDWVIFVHDEEYTYVFPAGQDTPVVTLPNNANFSDPQEISVHGIWNGETFVASIGAEKATSVALLDERLVYWVGAQDNVVYKNARAWLMPSIWDQSQIESWAEAQFPEMELQPYAP